jgi:CRISPR type IV-associated protein Csf3
MWLLAKERRLSYRPWRKDTVRITIELSSPMACVDGDIRLDALLHCCVLQDLADEAKRRGHRSDFPRTVWRDVPMPLAKMQTAQGDDFKKIYCASFAEYDGSESVNRWKKRWEDEFDDMVDFGSRKQVIDHKKEHFKSYDMPVVLRSTRELVFYARGVGEEIERLLKTYLTHMGKKGSQGYGRIRSVAVRPCAEDWSVWRDGKPMRAIPLEMAGETEGLRQIFCGYRPPYYLPEHQCLCVACR